MSGSLVPATTDEEALIAFLDAFDDGLPPLSEHKVLRLGGGADAIAAAWADPAGLAVVSVAARHEGDRPHWALEVAVRAEARRPDIEREALTLAASTVSGPHSLWAHRPDQIAAAEDLGYEPVRSVVRMEGPFPEPRPSGWATIETARPEDDAAIIAVHNRAFAGHREASGFTQRRLDELRAAPWFDPDGVVVARREGEVVGYCLTKLHPDGDGEVYFLAVDPAASGHRVGDSLAAAGYARVLARGAKRAMLWVDGENAKAIALYRRLGLEAAARNVELASASALKSPNRC